MFVDEKETQIVVADTKESYERYFSLGVPYRYAISAFFSTLARQSSDVPNRRWGIPISANSYLFQISQDPVPS